MSKVHLISGATSGIGLAIYKQLKSSGDRVIPAVRRPGDAEKLGTNEFIEADYKNPKAVREAFKAFDTSIDSFINCAGIAVGKPIWDNTPDEVQTLIDINLISPMATIAELKPNFKKGAAIFLFSSVSAYRGGWDDLYIASKGAINSLVKSLSIKFAPDVRVIGIAPGVTADTRMTRERKAQDLPQVIEKIPLKALATPEEISNLIVSLMGPAGTHITGTMIDINGGTYLR